MPECDPKDDDERKVRLECELESRLEAAVRHSGFSKRGLLDIGLCISTAACFRSMSG